MKWSDSRMIVACLVTAFLPGVTRAQASGTGAAGVATGEVLVIFTLAVALVLAGVILYVLSLTRRLTAASRSKAPGAPLPLRGEFAPILEELDGPQLDALIQLTSRQSPFPTKIHHDHAKEQLV